MLRWQCLGDIALETQIYIIIIIILLDKCNYKISLIFLNNDINIRDVSRHPILVMYITIAIQGNRNGLQSIIL